MNIRTLGVDDLIELALHTQDVKEMVYLQKNPSMNVRRALARNINIAEKVLKKLAYDPVQNVAYMATKNPKSRIKRDFPNARACVICQKDERGLNCVGCPELQEYSA